MKMKYIDELIERNGVTAWSNAPSMPDAWAAAGTEVARYVVEELRNPETGDWKRVAYVNNLTEAFRDRAPNDRVRVLDLQTQAIIHPAKPARPGLARWYPAKGKAYG